MKKILLAILLVLATGCTQFQGQWHIDHLTAIQNEADPAKKQQLQNEYNTIVAGYQAFHDQATAGLPCPEYFDMAIAAGFSVSQWRNPMARIMNAESGCNPRAQNNSSSAAGLMQELWQWADDCAAVNGTDIAKEHFYDPWWNIQCAKHVYDVQGWPAWSTY